MNKERLLKLAEHLETGLLGHEIFNFGIYDSCDGAAGNTCGTAGCAIGECPIIWPGFWKFNDGFPVLIGCKMSTLHSSIKAFFGLTTDEANHLFVPEDQLSEYGGKVLKETASRYEVAQHIRAFIYFTEKAST